MRYLKNYQQHNEGIRSTMAGIALGGSLLMGNPSLASSTPVNTVNMDIKDQTVEVDGTELRTNIEKLSQLRKEHCKDDEGLNKLLDEIKANVGDSSKTTAMFEKLSAHLETNYGYTIQQRNVEEANVEEIKSTKNDEAGFFYLMGWIGSVCLALCGVPQAIQSYKDKHSHGISWGMLLLWAFGEIFALTYVFNKLDMPMVMNYGINIFVIAVMLYYKFRPQYPDSSVESSGGEESVNDKPGILRRLKQRFNSSGGEESINELP